LIARQKMRAQLVGRQIQHLVLEHVFHFAACASQLCIQPRRRETCSILVPGETPGRQVDDDETRVVAPVITSALPTTRRGRRQLVGV
jgi:hypothetical protein